MINANNVNTQSTEDDERKYVENLKSFETLVPMPDHVFKKKYVGLSESTIMKLWPGCKKELGTHFPESQYNLEYYKDYRSLLFEMQDGTCIGAWQTVGIVLDGEEDNLHLFGSKVAETEIIHPQRNVFKRLFKRIISSFKF